MTDANLPARPVSIKLEPDEIDRFARLAAARGRKPHFLMREALRQYLQREEQRERFRQAALTAWRDYQETGLHVTHEEADDWLAQLEAGQSLEPPECHG